jgi:hypothetical protein
VLAVERTDLVPADQLDREMAFLDACGVERRKRRPAELLRRVDELNLDQGD